jgi:hypothetical protein
MPTNQPPTQVRHTAAAIRIAEILTGEPYGSRRKFETTFGWKTVAGLADLIDNEAQLPKLLETCQDLLDKVSNEHELDHNDGYTDYGPQPNPKKCPDCAAQEEAQALLDEVRSGQPEKESVSRGKEN